MADIIQFRRDTAARWAECNPILAEGELGLVLNSLNHYKIGDGIHTWNELPLRGFNGNVVDAFGDDYDAVISQAALTKLFKDIVSNNSHIDVSEDFSALDNQNESIEKALQSCGLYVLKNENYSIGYMLVIFEHIHNSIIQFLFGNFSIFNGEIYNNTSNVIPQILTRSAKFINNEGSSVPQSVWTQWKYINDSLLERINNIENRLNTLQ